MAIVYRTSDRIKVKVGELVISVSPLNRYQKAKVQDLTMQGKDIDAAYEALRSGIKGVEGLYDINGEPYGLKLDDNKELTDECIDDLMNLEFAPELVTVCVQLLNGIPKDFVNPTTGKKLKGVEFVKTGESAEKK